MGQCMDVTQEQSSPATPKIYITLFNTLTLIFV